MWQPSASAINLKARSALLRAIREYFYPRAVIEVDPPVIGRHTVTDPYLEPLTVNMGANNPVGYLQTSPEYFMKRMLASTGESMYYLGKAFRRDESGRKHSPEFTMLEWYRPGFDDIELRKEVLDLVGYVKSQLAEQGTVVATNDWAVSEISYEDVFNDALGVNPHTAPVADLKQIAQAKLNVDWDDDHRNTWLDLLFSHLIEPNLQGCVCVFDFPACQSALAKVKVRSDGVAVARRFEVYINGVELANGYWELTDAAEQRKRFNADHARRAELGLNLPQIDEAFMAAIDAGLPECAGVALGVDRLLMALLGADKLSDVLPFTAPS